MPAYKTHISFGLISALFVGWLLIGYKIAIDKGILLPVIFVLLLGSILPDLDSDEGKPMKITLETFSILCAIIYYLSWLDTNDSYTHLFIGAVGTYIISKFIIGSVVKKFTHHRGIFHSIPAVMITILLGIIVFNFFGLKDEKIIFLSGALGLGFLSHLILDELANFTKKRNIFWGHHHSPPSAIKFSSHSKAATFSAYLILIFLIYAIYPLVDKYWKYISTYYLA